MVWFRNCIVPTEATNELPEYTATGAPKALTKLEILDINPFSLVFITVGDPGSPSIHGVTLERTIVMGW